MIPTDLFYFQNQWSIRLYNQNEVISIQFERESVPLGHLIVSRVDQDMKGYGGEFS